MDIDIPNIVLDVDTLTKRNTEDADGRKRILFLYSPDSITQLAQFVFNQWPEYDWILTHNPEILAKCPNARLFEIGNRIAEPEQLPVLDVTKKVCGVSTVIGSQLKAPGHYLRRNMWMRQNRLTCPKTFYMSNRGGLANIAANPTLGDSKAPLFEYRYCIVIENTRQDNFFTEQLLDCLRTKTIPIYMGCPNIRRYFNPNGMVLVATIDDIVNFCNNLDPYDYTKRMRHLEDNYQRSLLWMDLRGRLTAKINELLHI